MEQLEKNKAIVRRFNKEFIEQGDPTVFYELVSPEIINRTAPPGVPDNSEGIFNMIMNVLRPAFPDLQVEIQDQIAEGDMVVTRKVFHGTHEKEFMGVAPSYRKVKIPIIDILRFKDGKCVEHWGIRDTHELVKAHNAQQG